MKSIDLNADLGEGVGDDEALLGIVSSASIACGGHAGNRRTMERTLQLCARENVRAGAHPGFADPENFGRRRLDLAPAQLNAQIAAQIETINIIAQRVGTPLSYVKLHGALANMAAGDPEIAHTAFAAVRAVDDGLAVLALDNSAQIAAAQQLGLDIIREAYADRAYTRDGHLAPRNLEGAVITDPAIVSARCLRIVQKGEIVALDGTVLTTAATSICLHGDTPGALDLACQVRAHLTRASVSISA